MERFDQEFLLKVNPVFLTAQDCLICCAMAGDPDAQRLLDEFRFDVHSSIPTEGQTSEQQELIAKLAQAVGSVPWLRYTATNAFFKASGLTRMLDIPCGYTPRAFVMSAMGARYFGCDLPAVAEHTHLTEDEVVKRYSESPLYCFMNGFTPGFPYLGGMDPSLETPRLKTPRELIPANSVAIGGAQAGAYSIASPGGWRIIGRVPYELYDPARDPAVAIQAGMWVHFYPVTMERYREIERQAKEGTYKIEYRHKGAGK